MRGFKGPPMLRLIRGDEQGRDTGGTDAQNPITNDIVRAALRIAENALTALCRCGTLAPMSQSPAPLRLTREPPTSATFDNLIAGWDTDMRVRLGYSDLHARKSICAVREYMGWCGGPSTEYLKRARILQWSTTLINPANEGSKKTAQNKVSQLRAFCEYLVLVEEMERNPIEKLRMPNPRGRRTGPVPFTVAQVKALAKAAEARENRLNKNGTPDMRVAKFGPLSSTLYRFLTWTGLRYGESGSQRWDDINLAEAWIMLTRDKGKRQDTIPLTREAVEALIRWREFSAGALVFPHLPSHNTLLADMEACGIDGWQVGPEKQVHGQWHRFRKTATTERAKAGADLRNLHKFSRHRDINQTLNVYDHAQVEEMRPTAELMPTLHPPVEQVPPASIRRSKRGEVPSVGAAGELCMKSPVDKAGGIADSVGVTVSERSPVPRTLSQPESPVDARIGGAAPDCDKLGPRLARASTQGSGEAPTTDRSEWSRGESPSRPDFLRPLTAEELAVVHTSLAIAQEAMRMVSFGRSSTEDRRGCSAS